MMMMMMMMMMVKKEDDDDGDSIKKKRFTYKLKFIDSYRFMPCKLWDLVDNLSAIHNKECKSCMEEKKFGRNVNLLDLKITDWITYAKMQYTMY